MPHRSTGSVSTRHCAPSPAATVIWPSEYGKPTHLSTGSSFSTRSFADVTASPLPSPPAFSPQFGPGVPVRMSVPVSMVDISRLDPETGLPRPGRADGSEPQNLGVVAACMVFALPAVGFGSMVWALLAFPISMVTMFCPRQAESTETKTGTGCAIEHVSPTLGSRWRSAIVRLLYPVVQFQLRLVKSSVAPAVQQIRVCPLLMVALLAPVVNIAVAMVSMVTAVFWLFTIMMGDPANTGKDGSVDGRRSVLGVRRRFVSWLMRPRLKKTGVSTQVTVV